MTSSPRRGHPRGTGWTAGCLLALALLPAAAYAHEAPPSGVPKGSIVAFLPDRDSREHQDPEALRAWLRARGWAICDGSEGTPDLNFRMLLGTVHPEEAGQNLGSRTHDHRLRGETGAAYGREGTILSGRGFRVQVPESGHHHRLEGTAEGAEHLPLSVRVLFIMKVE